MWPWWCFNNELMCKVLAHSRYSNLCESLHPKTPKGVIWWDSNIYDACVRERERGSHHSGVYSMSEIVLIVACVQTHMNIMSVTRLRSPPGLELMVKLRTLLAVFNFESWSSRLWKGVWHLQRGLWCSANHNALCQLANQSRLCLSEGGTL